jgi:1,4-dihydroxy-2-naphthoate polyprenyltransferase
MVHAGSQQRGDQPAASSSAAAAAGVTRPLPGLGGAPIAVERRLKTPVGRVLAWASAGKAHTLVLACMPVLVASALMWAGGVILNVPLLLALALGAALVLGGANLLDAYLDYVRAHALARAYPATSISLRAARHRTALLNLGIVPLDALRAGAGMLVVGACLGLPAAVAAGPLGPLLGLLGLAAAFLYSSTNFGLKRLPFGELAVFLGLGPGLFAVTVLSQHTSLSAFDLAVSVALGLYALAALEAANLRALTPEERDGRHTVVRLLGERGGRLLFVACLVAAYLLVLVAAAARGAPHGAYAVLFSLPVLVVPATSIWRARNADTLTPGVHGMLRAYFFFAFWLIIGVVIGALYLRLLGALGA